METDILKFYKDHVEQDGSVARWLRLTGWAREDSSVMKPVTIDLEANSITLLWKDSREATAREFVRRMQSHGCVKSAFFAKEKQPPMVVITFKE